MLNGKRILLIDEDAAELSRTRQVLEGGGYAVLGAAGGREGLGLFAAHPVHQVVLEYQLSEMNGERVAAAMRKAQPGVPILLYSGCEALPRSALDLVDGFMPKGTLPYFLLYAVKLLFGARPALAGAGPDPGPARAAGPSGSF